MKKNNFLWSVILLTGVALTTSCSDKTDEIDGPGRTEGEETYIQLRVIDTNGAGTKAFDPSVTDPALTGEVELASTVAVAVYTKEGYLDAYHPALNLTTSGGQTLTDRFKVTTGERYFYVMSNGEGGIPTSTTLRPDFEKEIKLINFAGNHISPIGNLGAMPIGTLWAISEDNNDLRNLQDIQLQTSPQTVSLKIGRTGAKVKLISVAKSSANKPSTLLGTFTNPTYRLRSIADRYFFIGQTQPADGNPPVPGLRYYSAVHNYPPSATDVYLSYNWDASGLGKPVLATEVRDDDNYYYVVENTSAEFPEPGSTETDLYFGNCTYVQMRIVYTPDAAEVYDATNPTAPGTLTGATFWTGTYGGQTLIFNGDPTATTGVTDPQVYTDGVMYYNFPVKDDKETDRISKYTVIRNHSYRMSVTSINNIGKPTDEVPPWTKLPEPEEADVDVAVEVLDWFEMASETDL